MNVKTAAPPITISLSSPAFADGQPIPRVHTADGNNVSPTLNWANLPAGTVELVLILDDPDAKRAMPFVHWLVYHLPPRATGLPGGITFHHMGHDVPAGTSLGVNSTGQVGYLGPKPPEGDEPHHYRFTLYALDRRLSLAPGADAETVLNEMSHHVLAKGQLVGTYRR